MNHDNHNLKYETAGAKTNSADIISLTERRERDRRHTRSVDDQLEHRVVATTVLHDTDTVLVSFSQSVSGISLPKKEAQQLASLLLAAAELAD